MGPTVLSQSHTVMSAREARRKASGEAYSKVVSYMILFPNFSLTKFFPLLNRTRTIYVILFPFPFYLSLFFIFFFFLIFYIFFNKLTTEYPSALTSKEYANIEIRTRNRVKNSQPTMLTRVDFPFPFIKGEMMQTRTS